MNVYLHGSHDRPPPRDHLMFVCPAGDFPGQEMPVAFLDHKNDPVTFEVKFINGTAEVTDELGRYMVKRGLAKKSRLILPNFFG